MQIKCGTSRVVLLLPFLGVAIKFPRVRLRDAFSEIFALSRGPRFRRRFLMFIRAPRSQRRYGLVPYLLNGLYDNRSEYRFYRETRNTFVWPTIFSFFGLMNVQPLGIPTMRDERDVWSALVDVVDRDITKDPHCFERPDNFCEDAVGRLYLLDYASEKSQWVVQKYERALRQKF